MKLIFYVGLVYIYYSNHTKFRFVLFNGFVARNRWRSQYSTAHISAPNCRTENVQIWAWSSDSPLLGNSNTIIIASLLYNHGRNPKFHVAFLVPQLADMVLFCTYYRCNNYVARKVWFCVGAWTWRHRHSHLNCLITQGST